VDKLGRRKALEELVPRAHNPVRSAFDRYPNVDNWTVFPRAAGPLGKVGDLSRVINKG